MKIITAYRPGGLYTEQHIDRLADQVKKYSDFELDVCFGEFPNWWCKMSLFKETGPLLYFDLDTTILADLNPLIEIANTKRFVTLRDFNFTNRLASGVMAWSGDMQEIYDDFASNPDTFMRQYPGGDQVFIDEGDYEPQFWQVLLPNHIQSYKLHVKRHGIHPECRVVCAHGRPKNWDEISPGKTVDDDIFDKRCKGARNECKPSIRRRRSR